MSAGCRRSSLVRSFTARRIIVMIAAPLFLSACFADADTNAQQVSLDPPRTLVNDSVPETVKVAAEHGWVACPGKCLKLATPGWHHQDIAGFPPSDVWMTYTYKDTGGPAWMAYSERHIGHLIETYPDKPARDIGICPVCKGTGWVRKEQANAKK